MSEAKYGEPWEYDFEEEQIRDENGYVMFVSETSHVDSMRFIVCVNACAGMEDPAAEIVALREENARLKDQVDYLEKCFFDAQGGKQHEP